MTRTFKFEYMEEEDIRETIIPHCQEEEHSQQVSFSTYHDCLTQICFSCKCIRSSTCEVGEDKTQINNDTIDKFNPKFIPNGTMIQAHEDIKKGQIAYAKDGILYLIKDEDANVATDEGGKDD